MSANTTIEWTDRTWNCVRGCSRVSPGCTECYAMKFAHRFSGAGRPYEGLTTIRKGKVDWSGVARFIPSELDAPLRWRKPERIFVNSMSDLFHHSLTNEQIAAVFGVMAAAPRHQFLVLTKRPERALAWFRWMETEHRHKINDAVRALVPGQQGAAVFPTQRHGMVPEPGWPLQSVWLGVSVENQETADERIPVLLQCPAAVRWISAEPLLGPLDLSRWVFNRHAAISKAMAGPAALNREQADDVIAHPLDWVVFGSESGPGARPMDLAWGASIVEQCAEASVPCFTKQIANRNDRKGGDPTHWPERSGGWPREFPA